MTTRAQIEQLSIVTDIRETRLMRLLSEATVAYDLAIREMDAAEQMLARRRSDVACAKIDFAKQPQIEAIRIWHDLCHQRLAAAVEAHDEALSERDDAASRLESARRDIVRIKARGERIADRGAELRRGELRLAEIKAEDDLPARSVATLSQAMN